MLAGALCLPGVASAQNALSSVLNKKTMVSTQTKISTLGLPVVQKAEISGPTGAPVISPGTFVKLPPSINPNNLNLATPFAVAPGGMFLNPGSPTNPSGRR